MDAETLNEVEGYLDTLTKNGNNQYNLTLEIESYKHLGFTMHSILKICQSALIAEDKNIHCHTNLDIFNLLELPKNLIPELEFLDILKKRGTISK